MLLRCSTASRQHNASACEQHGVVEAPLNNLVPLCCCSAPPDRTTHSLTNTELHITLSCELVTKTKPLVYSSPGRRHFASLTKHKTCPAHNHRTVVVRRQQHRKWVVDSSKRASLTSVKEQPLDENSQWRIERLGDWWKTHSGLAEFGQ